MRSRSVSALFTSKPASIGTFFKSNSALVAEALGQSPLDFLLIDRQHASPGLETVESIVRAGELHGTPSIVRIEKQNAGLFTNLLDLGAVGLLIPQIGNVDEVEAIADAVRYDEGRSYAMSTRAGEFGTRNRDEYVDWVNEELAIVPQIESRAGVENVESIAGHDQVMGIMVGPADLAMSYDLPIGDERVSDIVDTVFDAVDDLECGFGMYVGSSTELEQYYEDTEFLLYGSDIGMMRSKFSESMSGITGPGE